MISKRNFYFFTSEKLKPFFTFVYLQKMQTVISNFCNKDNIVPVEYLLVFTGYDKRAYDPVYKGWQKELKSEIEESEESIQLLPCDNGALFKVKNSWEAWKVIRALYTDIEYKIAYCSFTDVDNIIQVEYDKEYKLLMVKFDAESG